MTVQLQLRRGTNVETAAFCGAEGELTYDMTNKNLRIHDGITVGGITIDKAADVVHKGNTETISGTKTFSSTIVSSTSSSEWLKCTGIALTGDSYKDIAVYDSASKRIGGIRFQHGNGGNRFVSLYVGSNTNSNLGGITITTNNEGTALTNITRTNTPSGSNSTSSTEIPTIGWVNNPELSQNVVHRTGDETIAGTKTFSSTIQGTANRALYADLAECYQSDKKYPIGTLIRFGGEKDITIADINCNGVISDKPGYLLDYELEDSQPVALVGKTPIRVLGKIKKFDRIVLSQTPGVGKVQTTSDETPIAIALENSEIEEEKLIFCVTKFNIF